MTKTETALEIIAGLQPAWVSWRLFLEETPIPPRDKGIETARVYQERLGILVRKEVCRWLSKHLDALPLYTNESCGIVREPLPESFYDGP